MSCCLVLMVAGSTTNIFSHKHQESGPSVRVQTCATRGVTSAHTLTSFRISPPLFLSEYTHNIPEHTSISLPICFHQKFSVLNDPRLFIQKKVFLLQIKTLSLHIRIAFYTLLVYFITVGLTVLALLQSSNSIHQS